MTDTELSGRRLTALVAAIALLGALLRLPTLGHQSLWLDELYTRWLSDLGFSQLLDEIPRTERTPYFYYLAEWVAVRIGDSSEAGLRAFSAVAGTATIPVVYIAGSRLVSRRGGLVAALLVAVNPFLVWYSQEARSYALVVLLVAVGLACWAGAREGGGRALAGWAVASSLACTTHYFAAFVVVPQAVWLVAAGWRQNRRTTLAACAVPLVVLLAQLPLVRDQSSGGVDLGGDPLARRLLGTAKDFVVGFSFPHERLGSLAAFALVCVGIALGLQLSGKARAGVFTSAALGGIAVAVPAGLAIVGVDYIVPRNLIVALVPLLVALGGAYAGSRAGLVSAALLAALSLAIVVAASADLRYGRTDWRGAGQAVAGGRPRALVVTPAVRTDLIQPYLPGVEAIVEPVRVQSIAVVALATEGGLSGDAVVPPTPSVDEVPPGFRLAETRRTPTFSLALLTSEHPRVVTPAQLSQLGLADDPPRLFLQR